MVMDEIARQFREVVCQEITILTEGIDRDRVLTPFRFDDGDHLVIVLRHTGNELWKLTDEGHTYMRLTYDLDERDLYQGVRQTIISNALSMFQVADREGELVLPVPDHEFGHALYSYVQAILKIADISYLTREQIRSTFLADFRLFFETQIKREREFDWHDPNQDPEGKYSVDCVIQANRSSNIFVFALANDDKVRDATISIHQLDRWKQNGLILGIFENQEQINRKVLARFSDVCDKQFSSLQGNQERIIQYINKVAS